MIDYKIFKKLQNLDVKQLHYTLAQTDVAEFTLQFKTKKPKKKKISQKINSYTNILKQSGILQLKNQSISQNRQIKQKQQNREITSLQKIHLSQKLNKLDKKEGQHTVYKNQQNQNIKIIHKKLMTLFSDQTPLYQQKQYQQITIEDFHIVKQIGQGSYSKVFMAIHNKTGFICALKILQKNLMRQLKVQQNAIRQIKILSCLSTHPNIITLFGSFSDQNKIYLIMQLCTDGDLYHKCKKQRKFRDNSKANQNKIIQKVHILKQVCNAINEIHGNSIMHRDIKPENVLITFNDNIKLSDFGWAVYNTKNNLRKTLCGTPLYLAPQFIINCQYNDSIDIWSLGIMAYEMFTNQFPFQIKTIHDLVKIVQQQIVFQKIQCKIIQNFCKKALVKDYKRRADIEDLCQHQIFIQYSKSE